MQIRERIPDSVSGLDPGESEFQTLHELFSIPFVARWRKLPGFFHYAVTQDIPERWLLMAVFEDGAKWYVIGFMDGLPHEDMIVWHPPRGKDTSPSRPADDGPNYELGEKEKDDDETVQSGGGDRQS